jgi:2-methylcitrate dehydratase
MYNASLVESGPGAVFLSPAHVSAHGAIPAVLAAAEARGAPGDDILAGLAVAYEIHGEFAYNVPADGFHPASQGTIAAAAGAARTMGFDADTTESAVGLAASQATLGVGDRSYDPLALGTASLTAVYACLLAESGVVGRVAVGGPGGWSDQVGEFDLDLDPGCERVRDAAIRPYDVGPHAQSAVEAAIELAESAALDPADIESVAVETDSRGVKALSPAAVAAALVDRGLAIRPGDRADLDPVAERTEIRSTEALTQRAGHDEMPARIRVACRDGAEHEAERQRFTGHPAEPAPWGTVEEKFHALTSARYGSDRREQIVETVRGLEAETVTELTRLLE